MKKILYLGLSPPYNPLEGEIIYKPIIKIVPRSVNDADIQKAFIDFELYTHLVITSKTVLPLLFQYAKELNISNASIISKKVVVVGKATAAAAARYDMSPTFPIADETAEGMLAMLKGQNLASAYMFWPHSALSRPVLSDFFKLQKIRFCDCVFYDTVPNHDVLLSKSDIDHIDEIVFTSPSTVDAYLEIVGKIPWHKQITPIGNVTAAYLTGMWPAASRSRSQEASFQII